MNQAGRGARAENAVRDELGECGYDVIRSAASKGAADLVAVHDGETLFVQVKLVPPGKAYTHPSPVERRELLRIARRCGPWAHAIVAQRFPGSGGRPAMTHWYELHGAGPGDREAWIPRESGT